MNIQDTYKILKNALTTKSNSRPLNLSPILKSMGFPIAESVFSESYQPYSSQWLIPARIKIIYSEEDKIDGLIESVVSESSSIDWVIFLHAKGLYLVNTKIPLGKKIF